MAQPCLYLNYSALLLAVRRVGLCSFGSVMCRMQGVGMSGVRVMRGHLRFPEV